MPLKPRCHYDDPHFDYEKFWRLRPYENQAERLALKKLLKVIKNKESILDLGGGYGRLADIYTPLFKKCLLIDSSQKQLAQAKAFCQKFTNLTLKQGFVEHLPLENEGYQAVIMIRTLHHFEQANLVFKEIARILQPGGFLILEFANQFRFKNQLRALVCGNLSFFTSHRASDRKTKKESPPLISFHPSQIISLLKANRFKILKTYSVSNFRDPILKKIIPLPILLRGESLFSELSSHFLLIRFFGPSIFVLAQKEK
jgi:ubiquinone/menaquinone biosynthesis C-methylase UbiE